jgi:hypothetical protein
MADVKISALPSGVAAPTSLVPAVNGTTTQRVTVSSILALAPKPPAFTAQPAPPPGVQAGDFWLNGSELNVWDGAQWVAVTGSAANIVSTTEPAPADKEGDLWINPDGTTTTTPPTGVFSNATPPVYTDAAITEQANGDPIGLSADGLLFFQPDIVGGVPVLVNGRRYMLPLIDSPASAGVKPPAFTFVDPPATSQSNGQPIGLNAAGTEIYQPDIVAAIPIIVDGRRFMLPLIEE